MVNKKELEEMFVEFDASLDFDSVLAFFDVKEIAKRMRGDVVLEVGTSAGIVTKHLLKLSKKLDIVEGSKIGIKRTRELIGDGEGKITYIHELWEQFKPKTKYTDIVFFRGLEHVEDPVSLLKSMKSWLVKGGRIHIIVPNAHSLHRKIMVWKGELENDFAFRPKDFKLGHKRNYCSKSLVKDVIDAEFKLVVAKTFFVKAWPNSKMGKITMDHRHWLPQLCYNIGKLLPNLGTELLVVCEK